jgi:hypothetical protein
MSYFYEIAVTIIHKHLSKIVGFWERKLVHRQGIRSSKVMPVEKEEQSGETLLKKERVIGKETTCVASFVQFN